MNHSPSAAARRAGLALFLGWVLCAAPPAEAPRAASPPPARPNFVVIVTDDQRWDTLGYMPKLQRLLAANGVTFTNAFVTTPLCCPSRASILTGQYAHNHGVRTNGGPEGGATRLQDGSTLATWLKQAGYRTALVGVYLTGYRKLAGRVPPGWDEWQAFARFGYTGYALSENGTIRRYGNDAADYSTDVLAAKAAAFIRGAGPEPFFLYFAPRAPHKPFTPADRHAALAVPAARRPPNHNEADVADKPAWARSAPSLTPARQREAEAIRENQLRSLAAVDDAVEALYMALRETKTLNNTVILFTSDNGFSWGEHRRIGKRSPYEESLRVPLAIAWPRLISSARRVERVVLNVDIAPTLAELAGIVPPGPVNGRSLRPLWNNGTTAWREDFLLEHWPQKPRDPPAFAGVRSARWKYVEYETGEKELYDLKADPYELENLAGRPEHAAAQQRLARRLVELKKE